MCQTLCLLTFLCADEHSNVGTERDLQQPVVTRLEACLKFIFILHFHSLELRARVETLQKQPRPLCLLHPTSLLALFGSIYLACAKPR